MGELADDDHGLERGWDSMLVNGCVSDGAGGLGFGDFGSGGGVGLIKSLWCAAAVAVAVVDLRLVAAPPAPPARG